MLLNIENRSTRIGVKLSTDTNQIGRELLLDSICMRATFLDD